MDDAMLAARQLVGHRELYRSLGEASAGARVVEHPGGVVAAVVPARPERSVFNSVVYEDPDALLAVRDALTTPTSKPACKRGRSGCARSMLACAVRSRLPGTASTPSRC
jgi:hypothetical protein